MFARGFKLLVDSITDVVSGGVGTATTYIYEWNTGATTYSINNLPVGTYTITVTDENGCKHDSSYTINDNNALAVIVNSGAVNHVKCHNYCNVLALFLKIPSIIIYPLSCMVYM